MAFRKVQTTNLQSTDTSFSDPVIVLGKDNTAPTDIGFLGKTSVNTYAGIIRDSETEMYYLIDNYTQSPIGDNIHPISSELGKLKLDTIEIDTGLVLPKGTAVERPVNPVEGQLWFNTTTKMFEGFDGTNWQTLVPATYQITP